MRVIQNNLWLCEDCTIGSVNDDFTGLDYYLKEPEASKRMAEIKAGLAALGPNLVPIFDSETNEGIDEFSSKPCACCGSHLAGSRHEFEILGEG